MSVVVPLEPDVDLEMSPGTCLDGQPDVAMDMLPNTDMELWPNTDIAMKPDTDTDIIIKSANFLSYIKAKAMMDVLLAGILAPGVPPKWIQCITWKNGLVARKTVKNLEVSTGSPHFVRFHLVHFSLCAGFGFFLN